MTWLRGCSVRHRLWRTSWVAAIGPDEIVKLQVAMPEVPTHEGLPATNVRYFRANVSREGDDY